MECSWDEQKAALTVHLTAVVKVHRMAELSGRSKVALWAARSEWMSAASRAALTVGWRAPSRVEPLASLSECCSGAWLVYLRVDWKAELLAQRWAQQLAVQLAVLTAARLAHTWELQWVAN